jgi:hypothetical protein
MARTSEQAKEWYKKNREAVLARSLAYYYDHIEERREYGRRRYAANREKLLAYQHEYDQKKSAGRNTSASPTVTRSTTPTGGYPAEE